MSEPITHEQLARPELVALLLGWQPTGEDHHEECRTYWHQTHGFCNFNYVHGFASGSGAWPVRNDYNTARAVEDRLNAEGLLRQYDAELDNGWFGYQYTATAEQRITAALAVWEARKPAPPPPMAPPDSLPVRAIVWLLTIGIGYGIIFVMGHSS